MKLYQITVVFPELPAAYAVQSTKIAGSTYSVAVRRALEEIKKRRQIKGRHIKTVRILVEVVEEDQESKN